MNQAIPLPGWNESIQAHALRYPGLTIARVAGQEKDYYTLWTQTGVLPGRVSGKWIHESSGPLDFPGIGDWVGIERGTDFVVIQTLLPRKSVLERKSAGLTSAGQLIAVNVDTVFLCMSMNENFNLRRLERYLAMVWNSGAMPAIILTKLDLAIDADSWIQEVRNIAFGASVLVVSDRTPQGFAALEAVIVPGNTYAFIGSSGVGKSTIVNHLMSEDLAATSAVGKSAKGHHTTTSRQMYLTPKGAIIIDTPGMRELQLDAADLDQTFEDIEAVANQCKFSDCTHEQEPGCAVQRAIDNGTLSFERLKNYRKMQKELLHQERKQKQSDTALARWKRKH